MKVLISGALKGLGACLTKKFLAEGHTVFAGVHTVDQLFELESVKADENLTILPLDISNKESIEQAAAFIYANTEKLDVVINVAGVLLDREDYITSNNYEAIDATFQVNTIGPIYLNNLLLDLLKNSNKGTLINISSEIRSINGVGSKFATYVMSKTAIAQYGFILKATFNELNLPLRVFSVHPGRMKTEMGAENGEIEASTSAEGIYKIAIGEVLPNNEAIYIDYKGESML